VYEKLERDDLDQKMDSLPYEALYATFQSIQDQLSALRLQLSTSSHATPRQVYVHAPFSPSVTSLVLHSLLDTNENESILPSAAFVDCLIQYQPRVIYDSILNALAGWSSVWSDALGGAQNWNGRTEGFEVEEDPETGQRRIHWDTTRPPVVSTARGALAGHSSDSLGAFIEGLQALYALEPDHTFPKFIVFFHAHQLLYMSHATASAAVNQVVESGTNDGTFLAALSRLGELVSCAREIAFVDPSDRQGNLSCLSSSQSWSLTNFNLPWVEHWSLFLQKCYTCPISPNMVCMSSIIDQSLLPTDVVSLLGRIWELTPKEKGDSKLINLDVYKNFVTLIYDSLEGKLASSDAVEEIYRLSNGTLWNTYKRLIKEMKSRFALLSRCSLS
jgi:hypothetical protein